VPWCGRVLCVCLCGCGLVFSVSVLSRYIIRAYLSSDTPRVKNISPRVSNTFYLVSTTTYNYQPGAPSPSPRGIYLPAASSLLFQPCTRLSTPRRTTMASPLPSTHGSIMTYPPSSTAATDSSARRYVPFLLDLGAVPTVTSLLKC
jgi:hypothetical protein